MRKSHFAKSVTVYLRPETLSKIKEITDRDEISIGSWFREIVDRSLSTTIDQDQSVASIRES